MKTKGAPTLTELRVDRELMNASSENETSCDWPRAMIWIRQLGIA